MSRYILRRAAFGFLVTWLVFTTVFFLMNGLGDPAAAVYA